jgi:hypothetical protein
MPALHFVTREQAVGSDRVTTAVMKEKSMNGATVEPESRQGGENFGSSFSKHLMAAVAEAASSLMIDGFLPLRRRSINRGSRRCAASTDRRLFGHEGVFSSLSYHRCPHPSSQSRLDPEGVSLLEDEAEVNRRTL